MGYDLEDDIALENVLDQLGYRPEEHVTHRYLGQTGVTDAYVIVTADGEMHGVRYNHPTSVMPDNDVLEEFDTRTREVRDLLNESDSQVSF